MGGAGGRCIPGGPGGGAGARGGGAGARGGGPGAAGGGPRLDSPRDDADELEQPEPQRFMPLILRPERDDSRPEYSFFIFDILGAAGS